MHTPLNSLMQLPFQAWFFVLALGSSFGMRNAKAYSLSVIEGTELKRDRQAHVVVAGYSHGQGNQFVQAAAARLHRYQELFPDHSYVLFQPQSESFQMKGLKRVVSNDKNLSGEALLNELLTFNRIENLDFFSHSSAHQGVGLELFGRNRPEDSFFALGLNSNPVQKWRNGTPGIEKLAKVLSPEAWITLNGCNAAWIQGAALSAKIQRPVLAAATGTDFQRLHENDSFYFNNKGSYPSTGDWARTNTTSYEKERSCSTGVCLRMKPQTGPYNGFWGNYTNVGGLGFYKFFCNYDDADATCYKAMGRYLRTVLSTKILRESSPRAHYTEVLYDLLCPNSKDAARRNECVKTIETKIAAGEESYSPYSGTPAECSLKGCKINSLKCEFHKTGWAHPGTCKFSKAESANGSTTLIREVKNYLRGLDELGIR